MLMRVNILHWSLFRIYNVGRQLFSVRGLRSCLIRAVCAQVKTWSEFAYYTNLQEYHSFNMLFWLYNFGKTFFQLTSVKILLFRLKIYRHSQVFQILCNPNPNPNNCNFSFFFSRLFVYRTCCIIAFVNTCRILTPCSATGAETKGTNIRSAWIALINSLITSTTKAVVRMVHLLTPYTVWTTCNYGCLH